MPHGTDTTTLAPTQPPVTPAAWHTHLVVLPWHGALIADTFARIAAESDDPDTQTACFLTNGSGRVLATGTNALALGVAHQPDRVARPAKYGFIAHAESQAITRMARAGQSTHQTTMFLNWFPCAACASLLVNAGITTLVADHTAYVTRRDDPRYDFATAAAILQEGGVHIIWR